MPRLPAEWEPQDAVLLTWPHKDSDWRHNLEETHALYKALATCISRYTHLIIGAPRDQLDLIKQQLPPDNISLYPVKSNDTWTRDHGPITVYHDQTPLLLDFTFNGWGNKFPSTLDNTINQQLSQQNAFNKTAIKSLPFVLEGGAIESDGKGTLLTSQQCLLNTNRNPYLSQAEIEHTLKQKLGIHTIHWLTQGYLAGDDTDSHIDTLARLCPNNTIAYVSCNEPEDEHYKALKTMYKELCALKTSEGKPYTLVALPWPKAIYDNEGQRLPATYANFLISNKAVFVPNYNDTNDQRALEQIGTIFKDLDIIAINCLPLIKQHGSLHCITMQIPRGVLNR